jgi:hypothetical protein
MATAYAAGASTFVRRAPGYLGSDLPKYNPHVKFIECRYRRRSPRAAIALTLP